MVAYSFSPKELGAVRGDAGRTIHGQARHEVVCPPISFGSRRGGI